MLNSPAPDHLIFAGFVAKSQRRCNEQLILNGKRCLTALYDSHAYLTSTDEIRTPVRFPSDSLPTAITSSSAAANSRLPDDVKPTKYSLAIHTDPIKLAFTTRVELRMTVLIVRNTSTAVLNISELSLKSVRLLRSGFPDYQKPQSVQIDSRWNAQRGLSRNAAGFCASIWALGELNLTLNRFGGVLQILDALLHSKAAAAWRMFSHYVDAIGEITVTARVYGTPHTSIILSQIATLMNNWMSETGSPLFAVTESSKGIHVRHHRSGLEFIRSFSLSEGLFRDVCRISQMMADCWWVDNTILLDKQEMLLPVLPGEFVEGNAKHEGYLFGLIHDVVALGLAGYMKLSATPAVIYAFRKETGWTWLE
ncbi:hypothetical protein NM688_g6058 [Phlebia brevispora]|uniref:Uncharacterized protein n=1 Tax=Phlebia brevispora TaxID=194682 RepID=A0ACC1SKH8_9APHY|nr:hypothetical protein NM688_g6058 [Phlebia brevispora]